MLHRAPHAVKAIVTASVLAALCTAGATPPDEAPPEVVAAVQNATGSPAAQSVLLGDQEALPLAETATVQLDEGALTLETPSGTIDVTLPVGDGAPAIDDAAELAVWDGDDHAVAAESLEDGAARAMFVLHDADSPHRFAFDVNAPEGAELRLLEDGGISVVIPGAGDPEDEVSDLVLATIAAPWAVDASGASVPTRFTIVGATVYQDVAPTAATSYPVVADPLWLVPIAIAIARTAVHVAVRASSAAAARSVVRITAGMQRTTSGGFNSFTSFKNTHGTRDGYDWHHIVEQSQVGRTIGGKQLVAKEVHNPRNLVNIPRAIHQKCINSSMSTVSSMSRTYGGHVIPPGQSMRAVVHTKSFEVQHAIGVALLRACGVTI